ncbi:MAG TPA: hypothetical protein VMK12_30220 [Anaeromyxobacteraceae bacterium]|nr:hypothetical protein [Anaeromyxobacteraceae bacterium]
MASAYEALKKCSRPVHLAVAVLGLGAATEHAAQGFRGGLEDTYGPRFESQPSAPSPQQRQSSTIDPITNTIRHWNEMAITATSIDHTPVAPGEKRVFGEQFGPGRSSRAMAIVHIAMFDAVNAIGGGYQGLTNLPPASGTLSGSAAMAQAAHDTLVALYPSQTASMDALLDEDLAQVPDGNDKTGGVALGKQAAAAILALKNGDGSEVPDPQFGSSYTASDQSGKWQQDPISQSPIVLGYHWGQVKPFVLASGDQFRVPPPPGLDSPEYAAAYAEVKQVGGDGVATPTQRTEDQTVASIFWAYDATPAICAPPRLYNQIVTSIAEQMGTTGLALMRLLALANIAMADAAISVWESKYFYDLWRPVTGIRESDGINGTAKDATFTPLGAPASNLHGPNFTPPFPTYPSGHAGFGGATFEILRSFYGTDDISFTFVSDEWNGVTLGNDGKVRPVKPRTFSSLSQAEEENGQSRIYLGIHWSFDKVQGIAQGRRVADQVFKSALLPVSKKGGQ